MVISGKEESIKKINEQYVSSLLSGKNFKDENFPVASFVIKKKIRKIIRLFYFFARTSDDIADNKDIKSKEKLKILNYFDNCLKTQERTEIDILNKLISNFTHIKFAKNYARQLLVAFKLDAKKKRYNNWGELIYYCKYSANPIGRFFIELTYLSKKLEIKDKKIIFKASDNLCTALQIINHMQDCQEDFVNLNRIYIPNSYFKKYTLGINILKTERKSLKFDKLKEEIINKVGKLLDNSTIGLKSIEIWGLKKEALIILNIAKRLCFLLKQRNPLEKKIKLSRIDLIFCFIKGIMSE